METVRRPKRSLALLALIARHETWIKTEWVVALVHPKDPAIDQAVREVIEAFRKQFNRAQVMRLSAPTTAQFFAD